MGLRMCSAYASLPERQARHFFRHLLAALRHAHARGFLHCDVKPANVRLQLGPREGELTAVLVRVTHAHAHVYAHMHLHVHTMCMRMVCTCEHVHLHMCICICASAYVHLHDVHMHDVHMHALCMCICVQPRESASK